MKNGFIDILDKKFVLETFDELENLMKVNGYQSLPVILLKTQYELLHKRLENAEEWIPHHCYLCEKQETCKTWNEAKKDNKAFTCSDEWEWNGRSKYEKY